MKEIIAKIRVEETEERLKTIVDTSETEKADFDDLLEEYEGKTVKITIEEVKR